MQQSGEEFEKLFDAYLQAQHDLFTRLNGLSAYCRERIEGARTTDEEGMFRNVLSSIIRFESVFGQLEEDFWAYLEGETSSSYYSDIATEKGYHNFIDYLLGELEKCHSWIDDMDTELRASGWQWESLDEFSDEFWKLIDATEVLIEFSAKIRGRDTILDLLGRIPPQRLAPIEFEIQGDRFGLRRSNRSPTNVPAASMQVALRAIKEEVVDALLELQKTNCDTRFVNYFARLVVSVDRNFENISSIEIGINLVVVENALPKVKEELADVVYGRLIADAVNVRHFLSNFREWQQYITGGMDFSSSIVTFETASDVAETLDHEAFDPTVADAARYYRAVCDVVVENDVGRIRSSFIQGILNAVIVCSRETLKFIKSSSTQIIEGANTAIGKAIGGVAASWILLNANKLMQFADTHISLSWIKEVISVVTKHLSG